jgi:hypothetical protein
MEFRRCKFVSMCGASVSAVTLPDFPTVSEKGLRNVKEVGALCRRILEKQKVGRDPYLSDRGNGASPTHQIAQLSIGKPVQLDAKCRGWQRPAVENAPCLMCCAAEAAPEVFHAEPVVLESGAAYWVMPSAVARAECVVNPKAADGVVCRSAGAERDVGDLLRKSVCGGDDLLLVVSQWHADVLKILPYQCVGVVDL